MVTYILLVSLTAEGRQNFKKSYGTIREEFKKQVANLGGKMTGYVTTGTYDAVEIVDMPNDDAALGILLGLLSVSDIRTVTMRAFPEDEVKKAMQRIS